MPFRQRHCLPLHFANTSQWKRRRRIGKAAAATDWHHLPLLLLLLSLIVLLGRTEGRDALRPDIQLEAVDDATRDAELLIEEAVADAGGETAAEEEADGGEKSDGKSAGRVGPAPHISHGTAGTDTNDSKAFVYSGANLRDGRTSFRALLSSDLLGSLDPRLFVSAPKSLCKAKRLVDEADERLKQVKEEKHMFEDFLINKVFSPTV
ncbi:hypothetical protein niasHT_016818 [Heterodera trifolii]|uniref:Uncharacterized protein n=1 Tax=Heterodera trifolii TaxID=157864 RepID=A0ABD2KTA3_9BILA